MNKSKKRAREYSFENYKNNFIENKENNHLEILFWKVFRNVFLFKKIFSNFKLNNVRSYNQLTCPKHILESYSNGVEIIKDKVKSKNNITYRGIDSIYDEFRKDTIENQEFYKLLFLNYYKYFIIPEETIPMIIESSNKFLFKLYFNNHLINIDKEKLNSIINNFYKKNPNYINNYNKLKFIYFLIINQYTNIKSYNINFEFITPKLNSDLPQLTVKQFIKIIKILIYLKQNNIIIVEKRKNSITNNVNNQNDIELNLIQLKEIESYEFTIKEISNKFLSILSILNFIKMENENEKKVNQYKTIINKIIDLFLSISNNLLINESIIIINNYKFINNNNNLKFINPIKFFKFYYNNIDNNNYIELINYFKLLFNQQPLLSLISIIQLNDINLLKLIHVSFKEEIHFQIFSNIDITYDSDYYILLHIIYSIKSKEILEFYFENYKEILFFNNNQLWQNISSPELLDHYEYLMNSIGRKIMVNKIYKVPFKHDNFLKLKLLFLVLQKIKNQLSNTNYNEYSFNHNNSISTFTVSDTFSFDHCDQWYLKNNTIMQDILISIIQLLKDINIRIIFPEKILPFKILYWIGCNFCKEKTILPQKPYTGYEKIEIKLLVPTNDNHSPEKLKTPKDQYNYNYNISEQSNNNRNNNNNNNIITIHTIQDNIFFSFIYAGLYQDAIKLFYKIRVLLFNLDGRYPFDFIEQLLNHHLNYILFISNNHNSIYYQYDINVIFNDLLGDFSTFGYLDIIKCYLNKFGHLIKDYPTNQIEINVIKQFKVILKNAINSNNIDILDILYKYINISKKKIDSFRENNYFIYKYFINKQKQIK